MPRVVAILFVFLIIAAGCLTTPREPGPTTTQAPGATDTISVGTVSSPNTTSATTPSPSIPNGTLAPGVDNNGIQNASALLDAHANALHERGFVLDIERRYSTNNQTRTVGYRLTAMPALQKFRQHASRTVAGDESVHRYWLNATMERMLIRIDSDGKTQYRIPPAGPVGTEGRSYLMAQLVHTRQLTELLRDGEFEVTSVNEVGGTRRYTLVGTIFSKDGSYGEREVHVTVDGTGVIHALNAAGEQPGGGSFTFEYRVIRLDVNSVERPDWTSTAPAPIDTRPTVGFQNCTKPYLTIDNPGPDQIPAGTVVKVQLNESEYDVSLHSPLGTNEHRALYLTGSGTLEVSEMETVPADRVGMPNEAEFTVVTKEGMLLSAGGIGFGCESAQEGSETDSSSSGRTDSSNG